MRRNCFWESSLNVGPRCAVQGCLREARHACRTHPSDGYYCGMHRAVHGARIDRRNAELDSRPRSPIRVSPAKVSLEERLSLFLEVDRPV